MKLHAIQTVFSLEERDGGVPRAVLALSSALAGQRVAVDLLAGLRADHKVLLDTGNSALRTTFVHSRKLGAATVFPFGAAIDQVLARYSRSSMLVHDNGLWSPANISVGFAARKRDLPYILSPHGMLQPQALAYSAGRKKIAWQMYQRRTAAGCAAFMATSELERSAIRDLFPSKPIALIPNGTSLAVARKSVISETHNVLYMSKLHPGKNILGLLAAWKMICSEPKFDNWTLTIAGDDSKNHRGEIESYIDQNNLSGRVKVIGIVDERDKADIFDRSDLLVLPSFSENFGLVITEALAHGVPVIATHGTPWSEVVMQRCGWWVPTDPVAIHQALSEALSLDEAERRAMGERGRQWVMATFDWERIAEKVVAFYEWVLHGGSKPDFVDS